jgi:hypothetical protein
MPYLHPGRVMVAACVAVVGVGWTPVAYGLWSPTAMGTVTVSPSPVTVPF